MRFITTIIVILFVFAGCDLSNSRNIDYLEGEALYSCDCTDTIETRSKIKKFKGIVEGRSTRFNSVTDAEENAIGETYYLAGIKSRKFVLLNDTVVAKHLEKILADLVAVRQNPSAIKYFIHIVEKKETRGSIIGGHIYITTELYNECKGNDDILYALIGHEIGHAERSHGKFAILEWWFSNITHPKKDSTSMDYFLPASSTSFNQKFELEADYYGVNLVNRLHRDPCAVISFWEKTGEHENQFDLVKRLGSSHPLSCIRASCLREHLRQNLGIFCNSR